MGTAIKVLMMVSIVACLASIAHAIAGQATFYSAPYTPSACYEDDDYGVMIAAANNRMFANGRACGHKYQVKCTGKTNLGPWPCNGYSIVVTIVDRCPGCSSNQIDLSEEAFGMIANTDAGRIKIDYTEVYGIDAKYESLSNASV